MQAIIWMLLKTVGSLLASACVLRLWTQYVRLPPSNPLAQFPRAVTDWLVLPLRRVIPGSRGIDWASLAAAYLVCLVIALAMTGLVLPSLAMPMFSFGTIWLLALVWLVDWTAFMVICVVIVQAAISWINPHAPMAPALAALTEPLLAPLRRVIPLIGGVDLSPLALIIGLQLLESLVGSMAGALMGGPGLLGRFQ